MTHAESFLSTFSPFFLWYFCLIFSTAAALYMFVQWRNSDMTVAYHKISSWKLQVCQLLLANFPSMKFSWLIMEFQQWMTKWVIQIVSFYFLPHLLSFVVSLYSHFLLLYVFLSIYFAAAEGFIQAFHSIHSFLMQIRRKRNFIFSYFFCSKITFFFSSLKKYLFHTFHLFFSFSFCVFFTP
jgi:hypothetical protein